MPACPSLLAPLGQMCRVHPAHQRARGADGGDGRIAFSTTPPAMNSSWLPKLRELPGRCWPWSANAALEISDRRRGHARFGRKFLLPRPCARRALAV